MSNWPTNGNLTGTLSVGQGEPGKSLECMWRGTELGIRVEGEEEYQFVDLAPKLGGVAGREIELQVGSGYLQWRYKDEEEWNDLIAISALEGKQGPQGIPGRDGQDGKNGVDGKQGIQGLPGKDGTNGQDGVTPDIQIGTVTTLEPGQQATVTKRGTKEEPIFDFGIPKGEKSESVITEIIGSTLTLTTDKNQTTTMQNNTTIVLPSVDKFTEIHLFFSTAEELTLILPKIKWQNQPTIEANKTYEFIFTYDDEWLGGCVTYV